MNLPGLSLVVFTIVVNILYKDWHCDDEPSLGRQPTIASLSLGEMRNFELRKKPLQVSICVWIYLKLDKFYHRYFLVKSPNFKQSFHN